VSNIAGETRTLPLAIYTFLNRPDGEDAVFRLVIVSVLISFAALVSGEVLTRRMRRN
jgi:molybdate transport system permease protein